MRKFNTKVGFDLEFFILSPHTGRITFPAKAPLAKCQEALDSIGGPLTEAKVERDGLCVEINNITPLAKEEVPTFFNYLSYFGEALRSHGYEIYNSCSVRLEDFRVSKSMAAQFSKALDEVGCAPFIVPGKGVIEITPGDMGGSRYAGFHVHVDLPNDVNKGFFSRIAGNEIRKYDARRPERNGKRDSLYGQIGAYRETEYGVELRQMPGGLSNSHLGYWQRCVQSIADLAEANKNVLLQKVI